MSMGDPSLIRGHGGRGEEKGLPMSEKKQRRYRRLDRAERAAIERGLDKSRSAREIARDLGRSQSSIADEVKRNRTVTRGPGKGERVGAVPDNACSRLLAWPHVCNGCNRRRYHCSRPWRCEYSAARAQHMADDLLSCARRGVNREPDEFEEIAAKIRHDLARSLSPAQIAQGRADEFSSSPSTIYRWIDRGYAGMSNMELLRKVGYKKRKGRIPRPTSHGPGRSFAAFRALPEREREAACEMDCVIGRSRDAQCVLTLYLRCCKAQIALLLPEKTSSAVAAALDTLERAIGKRAFRRMFGLILTDNGAEFSDWESLEKSCLPGAGARCKVYYCDVRQSQQKAGCERNHVELRKLLPKGRGISFDDLTCRDMAVAMSQLNSEPRPSMAFMAPARALLTAYGEDGRALLDALGIEELAYGELLLDVGAINRARAERGDKPLI